jgi:hypothetical protein
MKKNNQASYKIYLIFLEGKNYVKTVQKLKKEEGVIDI